MQDVLEAFGLIIPSNGNGIERRRFEGCGVSRRGEEATPGDALRKRVCARPGPEFEVLCGAAWVSSGV